MGEKPKFKTSAIGPATMDIETATTTEATGAIGMTVTAIITIDRVTTIAPLTTGDITTTTATIKLQTWLANLARLIAGPFS